MQIRLLASLVLLPFLVRIANADDFTTLGMVSHVTTSEQSGLRSDPETLDSIDLLCHAQQVEGDAISVCGLNSVYAAAFTWICCRPSDEAHKLFRDVFADSKTTAGKLYALIGIYKYDHKEFEFLAAGLNQHEKVTMIDGCICYNSEVGDYLEMIRKEHLFKVVMGAREDHISANAPKVKDMGTD